MLTSALAFECSLHRWLRVTTSAAYRIVLHGDTGSARDERTLLRYHYSRATYALLPSGRTASFPERLGEFEDWIDRPSRRSSPRLSHSDIPRVWTWSKSNSHAAVPFMDHEHASCPECCLRAVGFPLYRWRKDWSSARFVAESGTWTTSGLDATDLDRPIVVCP